MANGPRQTRLIRNGYAYRRLRTFQNLHAITGDRWLAQVLENPVDRYNLLAGWLTKDPVSWRNYYRYLTASLDAAVARLQATVPNGPWPKLRKKIKEQGQRAQSKGTLAELAIALFLVDKGLAFNMEQRLVPGSNTNVDFSVNVGLADPVHIEVQWVTDTVEYSDIIAAHYGLPSPDPFSKYVNAVQERVSSKLPKFPATEITLVALDTTDMAASRDQYVSPMYQALCHIFTGEISTALALWETNIRERVDGVIWYASEPTKVIYPIERGYILNEHSPHYGNPSLRRWIEIWSAE